MLLSALRRALLRERYALIAEQTARYNSVRDRADIERHQLERFNAIWRYCLTDVPFYRTWASEHGLPDQIGALSELLDFPQLTKATIVDRADEVFERGRIKDAYSTGGSTGTPTRYPRGRDEGDALYANTYVGRGWWGIRPFDSYVHVWGHAHLFGGDGLRGGARKAKRQTLDRLANATRVNAYDMSPEGLESHCQTLLRRNPRYLVGYTSAIFKIARHIESTGRDVSRLTNLRAVIVTAETVTPADVDLIGRVFAVPVVIEYGAAETGVVATSRGGTWPLQVLWQGFIVHMDHGGDLTITTLSDRLFPLINYAIGDRAKGHDVAAGNALLLAEVTGRCQDSVTVQTVDGKRLELSAILPVHILKSVSGVTAVQLRQEADRLRVFLSASHRLPLDEVARRFASDLKADHPNFDPRSVVLEQIDAPLLTPAGKQGLIV